MFLPIKTVFATFAASSGFALMVISISLNTWWFSFEIWVIACDAWMQKPGRWAAGQQMQMKLLSQFLPVSCTP